MLARFLRSIVLENFVLVLGCRACRDIGHVSLFGKGHGLQRFLIIQRFSRLYFWSLPKVKAVVELVETLCAKICQSVFKFVQAWRHGVFFQPVSLQVRTHLTKRAPDAGDSAAISSSFLRLGIFLAGRLRRPRPSAGNANR